jgi:hypothetical protein
VVAIPVHRAGDWKEEAAGAWAELKKARHREDLLAQMAAEHRLNRALERGQSDRSKQRRDD